MTMTRYGVQWFRTSFAKQATIICLMIHGVELITNANERVATVLVTASSTSTFQQEECTIINRWTKADASA